MNEATDTPTDEDVTSIVALDQSSLELSGDQQTSFDAIMTWTEPGHAKTLSLGGFAGTGKSTLIKTLVQQVRYGVRVCAPTGKAAHVLRCKGIPATTVHKLIYNVRLTKDRRTGAQRWVFRPTQDRFDLVIVDEASMLSTPLVTDLEKAARKLLFVGDHGQLEPVGDDPGIMHAPDLRLENIHRQAEGSPILQFAHHVRQGGIPTTFGDDARVQRGRTDDLADFDVVLCGYNKTRLAGNQWVRRRRGFGGKLPQVGERVVCLHNNAEYQVFNGMLCTVQEIDEDHNRFTVVDDVGTVYREVKFDPAQFGRAAKIVPAEGYTVWDFGYVLTCHKAQGSEFDRVAVIEQLASSWSPMRWRYTAATRARKELRWVL